MSTALDQLRSLPVSEKLQIVEQLWDDIGASSEPPVLHEWHQAEATRRMAELKANPEIALTRDELWKQVDAGNV
jgi:putative addiction module component (TIGR02574 family)